MTFKWKVGFEFEFLAPVGKSRLSLAESIAAKVEGHIEKFFFQNSEPSKVPGQKIFFTLTPGFLIVSASGKRLCRVVDDITIQSDLVRKALPKPGWFRILSDDMRLLRLIVLHTDPKLPIETSLSAVGKLFGTRPIQKGLGMFRIADPENSPIAMAASLPGERERVCELITEPIDENLEEKLALFLKTAQEIGFVVPKEGAMHVHYDAAALCEARILKNLVFLLYPYTSLLRRLVGTNPACRRLGQWSKEWMSVVQESDFASLSWEDACAALRSAKPNKYRDYNLKNIVTLKEKKFTFEVRTFPVTFDVQEVLLGAKLFEAVLKLACEPGHIEMLKIENPAEKELLAWLDKLPLEESDQEIWFRRAKCLPSEIVFTTKK